MLHTLYPSLKGRTAFVSGGSSGIGAELVRAFAAQGSQVAFCGTKARGGDALIEEITRAGHAAPYYEACDVRDIAALQSLLERVGEALGPIRPMCWPFFRFDGKTQRESPTIRFPRISRVSEVMSSVLLDAVDLPLRT